MNPLLDFSGLPRFADIRTEHIEEAVRQLLADGRSVIDSVSQNQAAPTWDNFIQPVDDANERISRAWGQVSHLNAVMNNPALREVYNACLPVITQYFGELEQNEVLFGKCRQLRQGQGFDSLNPPRKKIIENRLRDFRLGGAELAADGKARFLEIQEELSALSSRFSDNLLDATNGFSLHVDHPDMLAGIPEDVVGVARSLAEKENLPGWTFTLHAPSYLPVMQYADDRALREKMYHAYVTRASNVVALVSDRSDNQEARTPDNAPLIDRILALRKEMAQMLGFECYAEVSLATKMASSLQQVLDFLGELAARAKPYACKDIEELRQFASVQLKLDRLESWDLAYAGEKLRLAQYAFSDQEVRQYFPEERVLSGMFRLVERMYSVTVSPVTVGSEVQTWHPDVRFFTIRDAAGKLIGRFYLDLYARPDKRGGAWMDDAITRRRVTSGAGENGIQVPAAYLTCNFSAPAVVDGKSRPALFTHDEVITLFHEFGHGLHHLLTRVEDLDVSGINGVEWDAVELPSQFMENFCWEWSVLSGMAQHADTGEPLPRALFDKMLAAKNFQSGLHTLRQIEFALFDMRLHGDFEPGGEKTVMQLLAEVRKQVAVIIPPAYNRFQNSFSHIFAGGYAAGYYSYKWAEVLSADAYSLFEENMADLAGSVQAGIRFRDEILAMGGSRPALESFIAFRGREPTMDALLRHNGMVAAG